VPLILDLLKTVLPTVGNCSIVLEHVCPAAFDLEEHNSTVSFIIRSNQADFLFVAQDFSNGNVSYHAFAVVDNISCSPDSQNDSIDLPYLDTLIQSDASLSELPGLLFSINANNSFVLATVQSGRETNALKSLEALLLASTIQGVI